LNHDGISPTSTRCTIGSPLASVDCQGLLGVMMGSEVEDDDDDDDDEMVVGGGRW
jgi:hypothetical protein